MATPYGNLSPGLQKILQDGLKWREGGAYDKELRRLQDMYPGFKQAKAQASDEGLGERIFDSYRPSQEVTDMYDLVNQLYSNYSDLYSNFESTQKAQGESYKAALKEWNRQDKAGDAADWTTYTRLNKAYESADSRLKDIHTRLESSSKEYDKASKNYEKLKANPESNVYTNPEGTFKNVGDDRWQNINTGNVRRADTFRNLNNTPVTSRMDLDREAKRADRQIALAINSDKVGRGAFETDRPRSAQPTLTEQLSTYTSNLPDGVREDMLKGGQTQSPLGDLAILGATGAAVKGLPALAGSALKAGTNLLKNEVAKMTISDAAFKKGLLPQLTKGGIKNWQHLRPWKAFTPQMLKTGPTPAAAAGSALTIEGVGAPAAKGSRYNQALNRNVLTIAGKGGSPGQPYDAPKEDPNNPYVPAPKRFTV